MTKSVSTSKKVRKQYSPEFRSEALKQASRKFSPVSYRAHNLPVSENLLEQDFYASGPNQKWAGDITYLRTDEGWLYLAVVIDLWSRAVIGWSMSPRMTAQLACRWRCGGVSGPDALLTRRYAPTAGKPSSGPLRPRTEALSWLKARMASQGRDGIGEIYQYVPAYAGLRRFHTCATCNHRMPPYMPLTRHL